MSKRFVKIGLSPSPMSCKIEDKANPSNRIRAYAFRCGTIEVDVTSTRITSGEMHALVMADGPLEIDCYVVDENGQVVVNDQGTDIERETLVLMPGEFEFYMLPKGELN